MKPKNALSLSGLLAVGLLSAALPAQADTLVTYSEAPNQTTSTLSGTQVFNFDNLSTGLNTNVNWSGVGSFNQVYIKSADQYGGAADTGNPNGSNYQVEGAGSGYLSSTLTLNTPSSYFGMWWSAGDPNNVLSFYNGSTLVAQYTTASLMAALPAAYDGNPLDRSLNATQPYAFINFYGSPTTQWTSIVFSNTNSTGFEADNFTVRAAAWNPTTDGPIDGTPVAIVNGTTVSTAVTPQDLAGSEWSQGAPAAPAPPLPMLVAFGAVALLKWRKSSNATTQKA